MAVHNTPWMVWKAITAKARRKVKRDALLHVVQRRSHKRKTSLGDGVLAFQKKHGIDKAFQPRIANRTYNKKVTLPKLKFLDDDK